MKNISTENIRLVRTQETLTITGGAGLSSLDLQLSLFCFFNLTGTFGVSTLVSQGLRDLLTSDQAEDNKNNSVVSAE